MAAKSQTGEAEQLEDTHELPALYQRREFMRLGAGAVVTAAAISGGAGTAAASMGSTSLNWGSGLVQDPYLTGDVTVETHKGETFAELDYIADDGTRTSLGEHGIVLASESSPDTPHNPVTLETANFETPEFTAFPRGTTYDDDADSSTDEVPVSALEASHWTTDSTGIATTGASGSVADASGGGLTVSTSGLAAGDVFKATFDLSTVGSSDATITSGMSRKFLQEVVDVSTLASGVIVEFALIGSDAVEVVAKFDPAGDASTEPVLLSATGTSQTVQARVGELETAQAVTLADIQKVQIRVKEADAAFTMHGLNLERETQWTWGKEEYTDADGNVDTRDVVDPAGAFSITTLSSLPAPFDAATIRSVKYAVEMRASHLPADQIHARVKDTPSTYDRPKELEYVAEFEWPTAYELSVNAGSAKDDVKLPQGRYLAASVATGINDIDEWSDVEDAITWSSKSSLYDAVDKTVTLLSSVVATDRTAVRIRTVHSEDEITSATSSSSDGAVVVSGGGGGGLNFSVIIAGLLAAVAFWKRKALMAFGR